MQDMPNYSKGVVLGMRGKLSLVTFGALMALIYQAGRLSAPATIVKADEGGTPQVNIQQIGPGTSLGVYYPDLKKMYFYQPFAGQPSWSCAYSIQFGTPGATVDRQPCVNQD